MAFRKTSEHFETPKPGTPEAEAYAGFVTNPGQAFQHLKTINFSKRGGLMDLGKAPWPSQISLDKHIRTVMALNLFHSIRSLPHLSKGAAYDALGFTGRIPTYESGVRRLVEREEPIRVLVDRVKAAFPGEDEVNTALRESITCDPVKIICGKARRVGCTVWLLGYDFHTSFFTANTEISIVALDEKSVSNIFSYLKRYYQFWPKELEFARPGELANSKTRLEFANGSKCATYTAGGEDIRSFQLDICHLSEYAHYKDMSAVTSMLSAIPPHCWVFKESTANGRQGPFYNDWLQARSPLEVCQAYDQQNAEFFEQWNGLYKWFFSWLDDPRYVEEVPNWRAEEIRKTLDIYEQALMARFPEKFTIERVAWRRSKIRSGECQDKELPPEQFFAQEYPADEEEMFQSTGRMPFEAEVLDAMEHRAKANAPKYGFRLSADTMPTAVSVSQANCLIWEAPQPEQCYVIGADVSNGLGPRGDASYVPVFLRLDGISRRQVGAFWSNTVDARELGYIINILGRWYNLAYVDIETSGPGQLTAATLFEDCGYPLSLLYKDDRVNKVSAADVNAFFLGFNTTGQSKNWLIDDLIFSFKRGYIEIRDPKVLTEMRVFQRDARGKWSAPADGSSRDDRVIGVGLANWADNPLRGAPELIRAKVNRLKQIEAKPTGPEKPEHVRELLDAVAKMHKRAEKRIKTPRKTWYEI